MSRRKLQWQKIVRQAGGNLDKVIPRNSRAKGEWLTKCEPIQGKSYVPSLGEGQDNQCSVGMTPDKEKKIRSWLK